MKQLKTFYSVGVLIGLSLVAPIPNISMAQSPTQTPDPSAVIYYFSSEEKGFVVESFDGELHQILTNYDLPMGKEIAGPGWSSSGKWFAWASNPVGLPYLMDSEINIFNREGGKGSISTDGTTLLIEWSPVDDLLLVVSIDTEAYIKYAIYNPELDTFAFEIGIQLTGNYSPPFLNYFANWSPNGEYISVGFPDLTQNASLINMKIVSKNGLLIKETAIGCRQSIYDPCLDALWWTDDRVAYIDAQSDQIVVEDLKTEVIWQIPIPSRDINQIFWDSEGKFAIIKVGNAYDINDDSQVVWELSTTDEAIIPLAVDSRASFYGWSPDAGEAAFVVENRLLILESTSLEIQEISLPIESSRIASLKWVDNQTLLIYIYELNLREGPALLRELILYSTQTEEMKQIAFDSPDLPKGSVSPQQLYTFSFDDSSCFLACVTDLKTGVTSVIASNSSTSEIRLINDVQWHPTENWFFLLSRDDDGIGQIVVSNQDGSVVRGLDVQCNGSFACYGWMPPIS